MDYLAARLPEYMVPAIWVRVEELPLNHNGKVDKKALLDLSRSGATPDAPVAPRNEVEEKLVNIWRTVFNTDRISIHDDFFELGGDSLLAIRTLGYIQEEFGLNIPMNVLFKSTVLSDLAGYISVMAAVPDEENDQQTEIFLL